MKADLLTTDQLRMQVEKLFLQHIRLCQDNFLYFVQEIWPDFICRKERDPKKWGHHQIIANEFTEKTMSQDVKNMANNLLLIKRFAVVEDMTGAAVFLASDESNYMTAQTISVNGGAWVRT